MCKPWNDLIPGVLCKKQMKKLCKEGWIRGGNEDPEVSPIGHSAIDLTLSSTAFQTNMGSVKPFGGRYEHLLTTTGLAKKYEPDENGEFTLQRGKTYIFKLNETITFKEDAKIYGQATAKSTIGRVDVLARLIVDGMDVYEGFTPKGLKQSSGEMYLEVTPMTFRVIVKEGISLSQLRLFRGKPENAIIIGDEVYESVLHNGDNEQMDGSLRVDLNPTVIEGQQVCAFRAKRKKEDEDDKEPIRLWEKYKYKPSDYWEIKNSDNNKRLKIEKTNFYILKSKEMLSLPNSVAVYCRAIDEAIGEMRIHYAGFAHPFFGKERKDGQAGTCLIFEVRGHDVDVSLKDGEKMAKLTFYRMSEPCEREREESYNEQRLELSRIFSKWPEKATNKTDETEVVNSKKGS